VAQETIQQSSEYGHLLQLAKERSSESRNELGTIIQDLLEDQSSSVSDREKNLMFKILESLVKELEASVRSDVAKLLAHRGDVPQSIITHLANDEFSVASPILTHSELLREVDLIQIIKDRTVEYQLAITLRREISEGVSEALVATGHEDVIVSLLENRDAQLSESTMEYLVEESKRVDTFQEPLVRRHDLPNNLAGKLYGWVSAALREEIVSKYDLPQEIIDDLRTKLTAANSRDVKEESETLPQATLDLVEQLKAKDMVNVDVLLAALEQGEVSLVLGVFVEMTGLKVRFAKDIIFDGNGEEIAVACRAINLTELQFLTLFKKTRKRIASNRTDMTSDHINKILAFFRTMTPEAAQNAMKNWRTL
jgi:uncharacterized protein (DUF2336 family)